MASQEPHPVRNGIVATVVGGLILSAIPAARHAVAWAWGQLALGVAWAWRALTASYMVPGWLLLIGALLVGVSAWRLASSFHLGSSPAPRRYTEDTIYGLKWRWNWLGEQVQGLWCFCPRCDAQLVYDDSSCHSVVRDPETLFICEHCSHQAVGRIPGGNRAYALSAVEREIDRRIRVGEAEL